MKTQKKKIKNSCIWDSSRELKLSLPSFLPVNVIVKLDNQISFIYPKFIELL